MALVNELPNGPTGNGGEQRGSREASPAPAKPETESERQERGGTGQKIGCFSGTAQNGGNQAQPAQCQIDDGPRRQLGASVGRGWRGPVFVQRGPRPSACRSCAAAGPKESVL